MASADYSGDMSLSQEILKRTTESYRRLRNTIRFLLSNLSDFDPLEHAVPLANMVEMDQYALLRAREVQEKVVGELYSRYAFHHVVQEVVGYCSEDLGAFYLDVIKDRLYTTKADSHARRSAQTALYHITRSLLLMVAPILCFTADEAWNVLVDSEEESTLYHIWHEFPARPWSARPRCLPSGRPSASCAPRSTRKSRRCAAPTSWAPRCRPRWKSTRRPSWPAIWPAWARNLSSC
ncbi:Isoleucine--tRNA ligase [Chromobacterium violaceum]|uniref:Isoleucine--tRNA ligase n=1 Tax=Chromobacterium violaceum TaxID=536 RepID=A0A3S4LN64_CHRVL|nr:Isoleucine--tRNA ligase [Chromobacterium violaceum]